MKMNFLANLHPQVVHFPIAFFLVYALLEIIGIIFRKEYFSKTAHLFLFFGVIGAVAAVLSGNSAVDAAKQLGSKGVNIAAGAIEDHEELANITMWYFTGLLVLRTFIALRKKFSGKMKILFIFLALLGSFLVYRTGQLGGRLVYKHGIGTDLLKGEIRK